MPRKPRSKTIPSTNTSKGPHIRRAGTVRASLVNETGNGKEDGRIWLSRIAKTKRLRDEQRNGTKDWLMYRRWYESEMWANRESIDGGTEGSRDTATVNTLGSIAMTYQAFLQNGNIKFKLKAKKPDDVVSAQIQEALINYEWAERSMSAAVKRIVQDVCVIGHGIGKTGYVVEVDEARKESDGEINYADYIRQDAATLEYVDPVNFLFDLSAQDGTLKTARWVAECHYVPYPDVMANDKYDQEVLAQVHTGAYAMGTRQGYEGVGATNASHIWEQPITAMTPEDSLVALWEIHDKKFKKRYIFAEHVPEPLLEEEWPYSYLDGFNYVKINFIPVNGRNYGMGIFKLAEDQALQQNRIRTAQFHHIKSHKRAFQALADLDPNELKKFTDGPDGVVFVAAQPDAIKPVQDAAMSQDFQIVEARIQNDIERLTGADSLLQGAQLPSRTTAGEISTRVNITRLKAEDRVWAVETGVVELARQVLQHLKANRTLEDVIEIVGAQGAFWQVYSHEDIQAETDVSVEYFAAPKFDPALDRQQRLQILQLGVQAIPAMQQAGATDTIDMVKLFGWVLKGFDLPDAGIFFKPALTPQEPLVEQPAGAGQGLQPAIAGQLAPAPVPEQPTIGAPGEGLSFEDLMMQMRGGINN